MKKSLLLAGAFVILNAGLGFAAPLNNLDSGQTAVGLSGDAFYIEHKLADRFTIGYQSIDRGYYGDMTDLYGQYEFTGNLRGIIGSREFDYRDSAMYLGVGLQGSLAPQLNGFASVVAGDKFSEMQAGASYRLASNLDLNATYTNFMPEYGRDKDEVAIGATLKF